MKKRLGIQALSSINYLFVLQVELQTKEHFRTVLMKDWIQLWNILQHIQLQWNYVNMNEWNVAAAACMGFWEEGFDLLSLNLGFQDTAGQQSTTIWMGKPIFPYCGAKWQPLCKNRAVTWIKSFFITSS